MILCAYLLHVKNYKVLPFLTKNCSSETLANLLSCSVDELPEEGGGKRKCVPARAILE